MTRKDFNKWLNFLLMHNIITSEEYNNIMIKSIPYIKK